MATCFLNDEGIRKAINDKEIRIFEVTESLRDDSISPVGYQLRVGKVVYFYDRAKVALGHGALFEIRPKERAIIITAEDIRLNRRIGGIITTKFSLLVNQGLSCCSTGVDPGWPGKNANGQEEEGFLAIHVTNEGEKTITLSHLQPFATIVFFRSATESKGFTGATARTTGISIAEQSATAAIKATERKRVLRNKIARFALVISCMFLVAILGIFPLMWIFSRLGFQNPETAASLASAVLAVVVYAVYDSFFKQ